MSNIKDVHGKLRLYVFVNLFLEYGRHVERLRRRCRRHRRAYAPTSNTLAMITMRESTQGFPWRHFRPPELRYNETGILQEFCII